MREKRRFVALDSWRGLCALIVAIFHLPVLSHIVFNPFVRHGWIFVDFFFVLSGFVISHAYRDRLQDGRQAAAFMVRRLGRVWPLHLAMLAAFLALDLLKLHLLHSGLSAERQPFDPGWGPCLASNVALLQAMPVFLCEGWNGPSWSISVEVWTYLIFGAIMLSAKARAMPVLVILFAGATMVLLLSTPTLDVWTGLAFPRCILGFTAGVFAHRLWEKGTMIRIGGTVAELSMLLAVVLFVVFAAPTALSFLAPLLFAGSLCVFAEEAGAVSAVLRTRGPEWLGRLSFSIYMTHWFVREALSRAMALVERHGIKAFVPIEPALTPTFSANKLLVVGGEIGGDVIVLVFIAVVLLIAELTHRLIERPGQTWFSGLARRIDRLA